MEKIDPGVPGGVPRQDDQNTHQQPPQPGPAADPNAVPGNASGTGSGQAQPGIDPTGQQTSIRPETTGYVVDPVTGQLFYKIPVQQHTAFTGYGPDPAADMAGAYMGQPQTQTEPPPPPGPDYGEVIKSVEQFAEGDATIADVVKTLYTNTAQDDQFWKGAIVGAAAAVLLTSGPVGEAMGNTFGKIFGKPDAPAKETAETASATPDKKKE